MQGGKGLALPVGPYCLIDHHCCLGLTAGAWLLGCDSSGPFLVLGLCVQIYVWSMKTGRLLEVLGGHEGPVHCLAFSPMQVSHSFLLLSSSLPAETLWDGVHRKEQ